MDPDRLFSMEGISKVFKGIRKKLPYINKYSNFTRSL